MHCGKHKANYSLQTNKSDGKLSLKPVFLYSRQATLQQKILAYLSAFKLKKTETFNSDVVPEES